MNKNKIFKNTICAVEKRCKEKIEQVVLTILIIFPIIKEIYERKIWTALLKDTLDLNTTQFLSFNMSFLKMAHQLTFHWINILMLVIVNI
jgi:hypothetical protein